MTIREFYKAIAASNESDEIKAFAAEALTKMDEKNEKRRNTPSKAQLANEPIKKAFVAEISAEPRTASELAAAFEISTQKASALLRALVAEGAITEATIKVKGKGKVKQYSIVQ